MEPKTFDPANPQTRVGKGLKSLSEMIVAVAMWLGPIWIIFLMVYLMYH